MADMEAKTKGRSVTLYVVLYGLLPGRLKTLIRPCIEAKNGYLAWRYLLEELEPRTRQRTLSMLTALPGKEGWPKTGSFYDQIVEWERRIAEYENLSGTKMAEDLKLATIVERAPPEVSTYLRLHVTTDSSYCSVRNQLVCFIQAGRSWTARASEIDYSDGGPAPMDVSMLSATKGKPKGKTKGDRWMYCLRCGGKGHWASECPLSTKGDPKGGKTKGEDKGKGKTKDDGKGKGGKDGGRKGQEKQIRAAETASSPMSSTSSLSSQPPASAPASVRALAAVDEHDNDVDEHVWVMSLSAVTGEVVSKFWAGAEHRGLCLHRLRER